MYSCDMNGLKQRNQNGREEWIKLPVSDIPEELDPNLLVETARNLTFVVFDAIDNISPLMTIEWPLLEVSVSFFQCLPLPL